MTSWQTMTILDSGLWLHTHIPNAADEPQQQEEPEPRSQAGQTSKQPVDCQRDHQDPTAPPLVSQVSPQVSTNHHA